MSERYDRLLAIVEARPLEDRLAEVRKRISAMIHEKRPPSMRIPAEPTDDDLFIGDTADTAIAEIAALRARIAELEAEVERLRVASEPIPLECWHEDVGEVLWWAFPVTESPYVGSPLDSDWPGYHTHFTLMVPLPIDPTLAEAARKAGE